jgi:cell cycle checkpoint control protein RAD9A
LKKPLQTSIAVEADEFDEIDVEDKLHAIIQHAGITGNDLSARYSLPARPIQLSYSSDAISCEFLIMTVGERGSNPSQKTKKGRKGAAPQHTGPRLEAASRRTSVAPSETRPHAAEHQAQMPPPASRPHPNPTPSAARAVSRIGAFDLRPTQNPPPPTNASESLFVEDEGWEPVRDEDDDEDNARLEWDHSADPVSAPNGCHVDNPRLTWQNPSALPMGLVGDRQVTESERYAETEGDDQSTYLEPTQKLSDVKNLALFPD